MPGNSKVVREKKLPGSGWKIVPKFVFTVFIGVPLVAAFVPVAVASVLLNTIFGKKSTLTLPPPADDSLIKQRKKGERREFDLILYGATGFTGQLAAKYIATRYGKEFRWAIAGRRRQALEDLRAELASMRPDMRDLAIVIADADDQKALFDLAARTSVVISTAGPFQRYGSLLVRACAHLGTGYCDITGEVDWVRQMICLYDGVARKSGARIVSFCGHDCVPWDLLSLQLSDALKAKGEETVSMRFYDEVRAAPSGGTLETIRNIIVNGKPPLPDRSGDPLVRTAKETKSGFETRVANTKFVSYSSEHKAWVGPFIMAGVMGNCVRRSNALLGYGKRLTYTESQVHPGFMASVCSFVETVLFGLFLVIPPTRWALYKVLPPPGSGPSEADMSRSFLQVFGVATGSKGSTAKAMIYINDDPAYRDTARMLVESGLALAFNAEDIEVGGGVLTPASCQGHFLIKRLQSKGTVFSD